MACFVAPLVQAIATTAYRKISKKPVPASLKTLETMLWGGSVMLIVDHVITGELTWQFPLKLGKAGAANGYVRLSGGSLRAFPTASLHDILLSVGLFTF